MKVFLLLSAAAVAAGQQVSPQVPAVEADTSNELNHKSSVSSLLVAMGFSMTCLAAAVDKCGPCSWQHRPPPLNPIWQEIKELLQDIHQVVSQYSNRPRHCKDLLIGGDSGKGIRHVYPYPGQPQRRVAVYCDHTIDGGGWTVFQRRTNDTVREDFYRTWAEYKLGFGHLEGEFWLGLDLLHELTSTVLQELRIDLADYEGGERLAKYGSFYVGPPDTKYRLSVGRYSGDAGDSFAARHHGSKFSTHDADNDSYRGNCALSFRGAWWYKDCHDSNLNGFQHEGPHQSHADGINWKAWRGYKYSLRHTAMMIRPAFKLATTTEPESQG